ncbi:MAG: carboxypeptidase regulatory-like domain-containing protein, partial [Phycisphaerales bacterium]|nr:carboxypeptidase regulatory-like domain-containing protein [Phycisphaerales bacterium]
MISTRTACALLLALTGCRAASRHASTTPLSADDGPILEGVVSDANGKPVENATITLYGGFATRWKVAEATTGPDGRYRFAPVQAGSMTQDERGGWDYYVGIQLEHPELVSTDRCNWWDVQIPADKTGYLRRDFHMIPGGTLQARLLDHTGAPMPG